MVSKEAEEAEEAVNGKCPNSCCQLLRRGLIGISLLYSYYSYYTLITLFFSFFSALEAVDIQL